MKQSITVRLPPLKRRTRDLSRYAKEIGSLAINWNALHENLADILETILPSPNKLERMAHAIWHSTHNDGAQRKMLRAAIGAKRDIDPSIHDEIIWLLNRVDNFLTDKRNDTFHTPFLAASADDSRTWLLIADPFSFSPRAQKLRDKDLLKEFKWYVDCTAVLANHARHIERAMIAGKPSPDRPSLPHLGQRRIGKARGRKSTHKLR